MDTITFIEQYCLVNGKHIKLKDYQKKFIKWISQLKSEKKYPDIDVHKNNLTLLYCL